MTTNDIPSIVNELPDRAQEVYRYVRAFITTHDYPPTRAEIKRACKISTTSLVQRDLNLLADYKLLYLHPNVSRGIGLRDPNAPISNVPTN